ncbi:MAG: 2-amino-4-hydroxy-6-hydroxymethyldihydropteridine diphosphokinase [Candidatus Nanopelagicales bacterium]
MTVRVEVPPVTVALGLGANLGDRLAALQRGIDVLCADPAVHAIAVSSVYETDPVGGPEQPDYLNAVLLVSTTLVPIEVLALAGIAEQELERVRDVRWGARTLDVDVLTYGEVVSDDPVLTLPHPRAAQRAFVLVPLSDVEPDLRLPGGTETVSDLLAKCPPEDVVGVRPRRDLELVVPQPIPGSPD